MQRQTIRFFPPTVHVQRRYGVPHSPQISSSVRAYLPQWGADGKPEIDPEQANTVRRIYDRFLAGDSLQQIANGLTADGIPTPMSRTVWQASVVQSILSNEKYKGDALLGKTYVEDCMISGLPSAPRR